MARIVSPIRDTISTAVSVAHSAIKNKAGILYNGFDVGTPRLHKGD